MTDSASSFRNSPLSMRMHEACVPTAWANKAATTAESTPPDSPQITRPWPTRLADRLDAFAGEIAQLPRVRAVGKRARRKLPRIFVPSGVCVTSG